MIAIYILLGILIIVTLTLLILQFSKRNQLNAELNHMMNQHLLEIKSVYISIKSFRHDYHNHIQKMKAHISLGQYEQLEHYLSKMTKDIVEVAAFVNTGNVHIDAVINSKLTLAKNNRIALTYKATIPSKLLISDIDFCTLLGNLIDNAIEAANKSKKRFIRLYIGMFEEQLYISVMNSTSYDTKRKIFELKTIKKGDHGYGLKQISNIATKYNGFLNQKNESNVFVTEIMIPNNI